MGGGDPERESFAPTWEERFPHARVLPESFFARPTEEVAPELLGKVLVSRSGGVVTGGRIVEVEAYLGVHDPGSHAATKGVTNRNAVMYGPPGRAYVYFTYGNHHMVNLVCEAEGVAGAVLVRALEPLAGVDEMRRRRGGRRDTEVASGPGRLAQALGVDLSDNGAPLGEGRLAVLDAPLPSEAVRMSGRVGLSAGHELDLRFYLEGSRHVSRGRTGPPSRTSRTPVGHGPGGGAWRPH
ncbi:MAG: DNA-3-methyladenine glycosylase [Coriobacteriia bacterium]|nr:DNA-3-methyladenine glycosylase [Coriobacteriia bacterium]